MSSDAGKLAFSDALAAAQSQVERRLAEIVEAHVTGAGIEEAIRYTLLGGGKRLRPVLCLWAHDAVGGKHEDACLDVACAIECVHTYSLVHDDLPCMDDDDMRRGKPSCHRRFGEDMAVLTGDALLTLCFDVLGALGDRHAVSADTIVSVVKTIAHAAGTAGLITGQVLDLSLDSGQGDLGLVDSIHRHKTASLIAASMESGVIVAGATADERERLRVAGLAAGRAFQIADDVLDIRMDGSTLGKTPGKDARHRRLTYPSVAGVDEATRRARELVAEAKGHLPDRAWLLSALFQYLVDRTS